jgi:hypothetical protein
VQRILFIMPCPPKAALRMRAQAALARSSRSSFQNSCEPSILSIDIGGAYSSAQSTPPISPMPSKPSDDFNDVADGEFEEEQAGGQADSSDDASNAGYVSPGIPEHDSGYNTWDDMSELEDDELRGSLGQQKALEVEQNKEKTRNALEVLMQDGTAKKLGGVGHCFAWHGTRPFRVLVSIH